MRTTIRLDDHLLREAKARAARAGRSLNGFIEDAVRSAALGDRRADSGVPVIPVFRGGRGLPRHAEYRACLDAAFVAQEPMAISELILSGVLRVLTNPRVFNRDFSAKIK